MSRSALVRAPVRLPTENLLSATFGATLILANLPFQHINQTSDDVVSNTCYRLAVSTSLVTLSMCIPHHAYHKLCTIHVHSVVVVLNNLSSAAVEASQT